jgi:hypothetical protein
MLGGSYVTERSICHRLAVDLNEEDFPCNKKRADEVVGGDVLAGVFE